MWVYRLGAERAKRMLLTGDLIDGKEAAQIGLITKAVPEDQLDQGFPSLVSLHYAKAKGLNTFFINLVTFSCGQACTENGKCAQEPINDAKAGSQLR